MSACVPPDPSMPVMQVLHQAELALKRGDVAYSLTLAKAALRQAHADRDLHSEARALLALAHVDQRVSRFRRAQETAQRAANLFQMCDDPRGEAEALAALAHTLSVMGHSDEGVEQALLGVKLNTGAPTLSQALSHNYLGVAYAYGWSFDKAEAAFVHATEMLEAKGLWMETYLPRFNHRAMEITRCFFDRFYHGQFKPEALERLSVLRRAGARSAKVHPSLLALQGTLNKTQALLRLADGFEACWNGRLGLARTHADYAQASQVQVEVNLSLLVVEMWLRAEIAWASHDWESAEQYCQRMLREAMAIDHEHLVAIGYLLLSQIFSAQGKDTASQGQLRALKQRENQLRHAGIQWREERIEWQLQARASRATARRLEQHAQRLEQLAMEDPLTGLFNRRHLEATVPKLLRRGSERGHLPAMAFVDVDFFKRINDQFSHQVGDAVLQEIAHILRKFVREGDIAVRLGGDEFVLVFAHVEQADAEGMVRRIQNTVDDHAWDRLYPGLTVSVSVGVAGAEPGDSLQSWLHRCDVGMYVEKDSRHQSSF